MHSSSSVVNIAVALIFAAVLASGCSGNQGAISPDVNGPASPTTPAVASSAGPSDSAHRLWGWFLVYVDPQKSVFEVTPLRGVAGHWNVLKWLEQTPCANCFKIVKATPSDHYTLLVDVQLVHPFSGMPKLTGFDVRGIAMFNASKTFPTSGLTLSDWMLGDGAIMNADGYTTLYNSTTVGSGPGGLQGYIKGKHATATPPNSLLNGYRLYSTSSTRNMFEPGKTVTRTYDVSMPYGPFVFGYAVDASWAPQVDGNFPPEANCPEAYKIEVLENSVSGGMDDMGGTAELTLRIFDWQGKDDVHPPKLECPELFDGEITASWSADTADYTEYTASITNTKAAPAGYYTCLVSKEAKENDPVGKPWLDLTAYQIHTLVVSSAMEDITPPQLNFSPYDVAIDGNYAYVAAGPNGLHIFDVTDPANPKWVNSVPFPDRSLAVAVANGYAFLAEYANGLKIIDVDPPEDAHIVNTIWTFGNEDVVVSGGYAYVASGPELDIVDIDPIESADIVKTVPISGGAYGVAISGDYAYVTAFQELDIVKINPIDSASVVKTVPATVLPRDIAVSNGYAYVTGDADGLQIIDVSVPESASVVKTVDTPGLAYGVDVLGGFAYVADTEEGVQVIDVDPPKSAYVMKAVQVPGYAYKIHISGNLAYLADGSGGLSVLDITNPMSTKVVKTLDTPGYVYDVTVHNGLAYLANQFTGVQIVDVDPVQTPTIIKNVPQYDGNCMGLDYQNGYVYAAYGWEGLGVVDVDPPESAYLVSLVDLPQVARNVAVANGYAFVAHWQHSMQIVDVDPPDSAVSFGAVILNGDPWDVAISGDYAYVATESEGLNIISINPVDTAHVVNLVATTGVASSVAISGNYAYLADGDNGLQIIDITQPDTASIVKTIDTDGTALGVAVDGNHAYIADGSMGLKMIDIDSVDSAHVVSALYLPGYAVGVCVSGDYAYVACSDGGLRIVKLP